jgi:hypothetical protein
MTRGDDVAQNSGPTEPKWGWPGSLLWPAGQGLAYFRKSFHTRVKGGQWSRSVTLKVGEDQEGWLASHVYGGPGIQVLQTASSLRFKGVKKVRFSFL